MRIEIQADDGMSMNREINDLLKFSSLELQPNTVDFWYNITEGIILELIEALQKSLFNGDFRLLVTSSLTNSISFYGRFGKNLCTTPNDLIFKKNENCIYIFKNEELYLIEQQETEDLIDLTKKDFIMLMEKSWKI